MSGPKPVDDEFDLKLSLTQMCRIVRECSVASTKNLNELLRRGDVEIKPSVAQQPVELEQNVLTGEISLEPFERNDDRHLIRTVLSVGEAGIADLK